MKKFVHTTAKYFNAFCILLFIGTTVGYNMRPASAYVPNESATIRSEVDAILARVQEESPDIYAEFSEEERYCLQQNIYFEARNISNLSMRAVGWVTMNRVDSDRYPDTICDVVWQDSQFSWTHDGKSDKPGENVLEQEAWDRAGRMTDLVLTNYLFGREGPVGDAMYYHTTSVHPRWARHMDRVAQIDNHIFYEKEN